MGQYVVARDKVELHSSCVILKGQQPLPHDGVLLLIGKQSGSEPVAGQLGCAGQSSRQQLAGLSQT
jgi:hypothetical protein